MLTIVYSPVGVDPGLVRTQVQQLIETIDVLTHVYRISGPTGRAAGMRLFAFHAREWLPFAATALPVGCWSQGAHYRLLLAYYIFRVLIRCYQALHYRERLSIFALLCDQH